jgi:hypothetical protein
VAIKTSQNEGNSEGCTEFASHRIWRILVRQSGHPYYRTEGNETNGWFIILISAMHIMKRTDTVMRSWKVVL